mmetsp:Transcript_21779/g.64201  ORF Transcript_21779/g.64201 Transcript_21779/m.64201 type:complete len:272 (-) Transcript_21779:434-1249(-)
MLPLLCSSLCLFPFRSCPPPSLMESPCCLPFQACQLPSLCHSHPCPRRSLVCPRTNYFPSFRVCPLIHFSLPPRYFSLHSRPPCRPRPSRVSLAYHPSPRLRCRPSHLLHSFRHSPPRQTPSVAARPTPRPRPPRPLSHLRARPGPVSTCVRPPPSPSLVSSPPSSLRQYRPFSRRRHHQRGQFLASSPPPRLPPPSRRRYPGRVASSHCSRRSHPLRPSHLHSARSWNLLPSLPLPCSSEEGPGCFPATRASRHSRPCRLRGPESRSISP